tara:strand:- start:295 stop:804 length:510 start_codon:yes stop_codon:yes gene_type:complete
MTLFHLWRGSLQDILIFGIAALVILTQVFGLINFGFNGQPKFAAIPITLVVVVTGVVMFFTERHGFWNWVVVLSLIPVGIALLFYTDAKTQLVETVQVLRSRWVWAIWAIGFGLIEIGAYLASKIYDDLETFPSISSLVDPMLDGAIGRAAFVILWLISGVYLFGVRRR